MTLRITAQGRLQSLCAGIWTTLPPKRSSFELFRMYQRGLYRLISLMAAVAALQW